MGLFFCLLGEHAQEVYITDTIATWDLPDIYVCLCPWAHISGKS